MAADTIRPRGVGFHWFVVAGTLLLLGLAGTAAAQSQASPPDSAKAKRFSWVVLPNVFYTPVTRWAGGLAGQVIYRRSVNSRPSSLSGVVTYTQNRQVVTELLPELYRGGTRLSGKINFTRWPDTFFGVGDNLPESNEESFSSNIFFIHAEAQRTARRGVRVGLQYDVRYDRVFNVERGGLLDTGAIPGSGRGLASGIGTVIDWDTRDDLFSPTKGRFYRLSIQWLHRAFGSDYDAGKYTIDLRQYLPVLGSHTLAVQAYGSFTAGATPFQMLPQLGGPRLMRGYFGSRYRDNHMLILQAEYRFPVWWRFGLAGFAGVGDVANRLGDFRWDDAKFNAGAGLRFQISPREKVNLRIDYGFGLGNDTSRLYITVLEAI